MEDPGRLFDPGFRGHSDTPRAVLKEFERRLFSSAKGMGASHRPTGQPQRCDARTRGLLPEDDAPIGATVGVEAEHDVACLQG